MAKVTNKNKKVQATLNYLRISPRKVRAVAGLVRDKWAYEAEEILVHTNKKAASPVLKLLNSAVANAVNNTKLSQDKLFVQEIFVNGGPIFSRYMPRARGSAAEIQKKTSHVTIILAEKEGGTAKRSATFVPKSKTVKVPAIRTSPKTDSNQDKGFTATPEKIAPKKSSSGIGRRLFTRKAI
ncbi:MAG: 50S ribosomal protein L22 [Candidatus Terrybacteria bacterium RIFCSPLOWO2_01_FULL_40_23]|uniref:Large ribosomal subunit protein uL22 n=1 Tax=Candidatus Terrybacteria bacterium RIFCSPLOWO2_01_FULL_40_23 TaxID=1802366 RepID=A0A1G2PUS6_9BACT|nr:MAG: 50S ribosomal protein L22 [Candidatus Terrybacteria bacterium RIFCSPLOWO2_01_FULL_40_23]